MRRFFWKLGRVCFRFPDDPPKEGGGGGGAPSGGGGSGTPAAGALDPDGRTVKAMQDDLARVTAQVAKHDQLLGPVDDPDDDEEEDDDGDPVAEGIAILSGQAVDVDDEEEEKPRKKKGKAA